MITSILLAFLILPIGMALHGFTVDALIFAGMVFGIPFCSNLVRDYMA